MRAYRLLPAIFLFLLATPVLAQDAGKADPSPLAMAQFELSKSRLVCPQCRPDWRVILRNAGRPLIIKGQKIVGHIVLADLASPKLKVMTSKPVPDKTCEGRQYVARNYEEQGKRTLPVRLRTAQEWAHKLGIDVAFNANFFKYPADQEYWSRIPCGEPTGVVKSGGKIYWPPEGQENLLKEPIDNIAANETWVLAFSRKNFARILKPKTFGRLNAYDHVIAGSPLYAGYWNNPDIADIYKKKKARLGVGILPGSTKVLVIMIEGPESPNSNSQGLRADGLRILFRAFGAVSAISLQGGPFAQVATPSGTVSTPFSSRGPAPVANHFGFRVVTGEALPLP